MRHRNDLDAFHTLAKDDQVWESTEHRPAGFEFVQLIPFRML
jgi:hypothetical protein